MPGAATAGVLAGCNGGLTEGPGNETATEELPEVSTRAPAYGAVTPSMAVDGFQISLLVELQDLAGGARSGRRPQRLRRAGADGSRGFEPGLYVSIGPAIREVVDDAFVDAPRIVHVDAEGRPRPFVREQFGVETMTWAEGDYGDGFLFTEPHSHQVARALPDGSVETLAEDVGGPLGESEGPFPLGPAGLAFGPDGEPFVTDYVAKELLRVSPGGVRGRPRRPARHPVADEGAGRRRRGAVRRRLPRGDVLARPAGGRRAVRGGARPGVRGRGGRR